MKDVVAREVQQFVHAAGDQTRAIYNAITFLDQVCGWLKVHRSQDKQTHPQLFRTEFQHQSYQQRAAGVSSVSVVSRELTLVSDPGVQLQLKKGDGALAARLIRTYLGLFDKASKEEGKMIGGVGL
jgi:hypothetical protein